MRNIRFLHRPQTHSRRPLYDCLQKFAFPNTNKLVISFTKLLNRFIILYFSLFLLLYIVKSSNLTDGICSTLSENLSDKYYFIYIIFFYSTIIIILENSKTDMDYHKN